MQKLRATSIDRGPSAKVTNTKWDPIYLDPPPPQPPSIIPQIPTIEDHKGSIEGALGGPI